MFALKDLYQEVIVDHNRTPRNFGHLAAPTHRAEGFNPLCGDRLTIELSVDDDGVISDVAFDGQGCAISVASASLMTEALKGRPLSEVEPLFERFHSLLTKPTESDEFPQDEALGKLIALAGVRAYPSRVKCATLCWHALRSAAHGEPVASTE
jgi:nitrogen fixation protein NifU and related proteins